MAFKLVRLTALEKLEIGFASSSLSSSLVPLLSSFLRLSTLDISARSRAPLLPLPHLPQLTYLIVASCIAGDWCISLTKLPMLRFLQLGAISAIRREHLEALSCLTQLTTARLDISNFSNDVDWTALSSLPVSLTGKLLNCGNFC